ncbi:MAG TPA: hypothetical protein VEV81_07275 [Pyrinomonadaceae bacterium]|nr:hypothetical protein [Pyrinomonadaceae bacterium]
MALNHIAGAGAGTSTDERAFAAADERAANAADGAADERTLSPAVMVTTVPSLREAFNTESPEKQEEADQ